ncbi:HAD-IIB family hydrolase [Aestuariibacter salexigens]|uniref:HAD-IIB family hydrolase n=1 Tax=Aestuariibacter salexigens TaxID=226010 RepID=UPI00041E6DC3|nr:HAD-IIB family hydrolase [Aestuariibacter salexigens]
MKPTRFVIFTDMDGTLLDHDSYSHADADPLLQQLQRVDIPVIPNTSKTFAEVVELRQELHLTTPFIVENGAAIHFPKDFLPHKPTGSLWQDNHWVKQLTTRKQYWLTILEQMKASYAGQFTHFSAMTIDDICDSTGLSPAQAELAAKRSFGEPVLWLGSEQQKQRFVDQLHSKGAKTLQGGRFLHVGGDCDKGTALRWTMNEIASQRPEFTWQSIALGDGHNDVAMLQAADVAVRIRSRHHAPPDVPDHPLVITSSEIGPTGWAETLNEFLKPVLEDTQYG